MAWAARPAPRLAQAWRPAMTDLTGRAAAAIAAARPMYAPYCQFVPVGLVANEMTARSRFRLAAPASRDPVAAAERPSGNEPKPARSTRYPTMATARMRTMTM